MSNPVMFRKQRSQMDKNQVVQHWAKQRAVVGRLVSFLPSKFLPSCYVMSHAETVCISLNIYLHNSDAI